LYRASGERPTFTNVITQDSGSQRFPYLQGLLDPDSNNRQPYIRFCEVSVFDGKRNNTFYFCFKNHSRLPKNKTVRSLSGGIWKGDIIILRVGMDHQRVVNMRGHDAKLADFILKKYVLKCEHPGSLNLFIIFRCVQHVRQGQCISIPKNLHFVKRV
jgi:hypothetical protein